MSGSSPRMRGKQARRRNLKHNTLAHPRACGENFRSARVGGVGTGSSPRMRGKRPGSGTSAHYVGLIPAHAGKTVAHARKPPIATAHPRACGENYRPCRTRPRCHGSSPRMRGKHLQAFPLGWGCGLIPAHAGKTLIYVNEACRKGAHPRACGENMGVKLDLKPNMGSSPRMRGKHTSRSISPAGERLIPAHAGKTSGSAEFGSRVRAHPRACGENL